MIQPDLKSLKIPHSSLDPLVSLLLSDLQDLFLAAAVLNVVTHDERSISAPSGQANNY